MIEFTLGLILGAIAIFCILKAYRQLKIALKLKKVPKIRTIDGQEWSFSQNTAKRVRTKMHRGRT